MATIAIAGCDRATEPTAPIAPSASLAESPSVASPATNYTRVDISNGYESSANGINATWVIVGSYDVGGTSRGFIRDPQTGAFTPIYAINSHLYNVASDINDGGVVVGTSYSSATATIGWIKLSGQAPKQLKQGSCIASRANALNNHGDVVGMCNGQPALWTSFGTSSPVIALSLDPNVSGGGEVFDINDAGVMVGWSRAHVHPLRTATRWASPSTPVAVSIPSATGDSEAYSINVASRVAGYFYQGTSKKGFVRDVVAGTTTTLPNPAWGISNYGRIIGVGSAGQAWTIAPGSATPKTLSPAAGQTIAFDVNTCGRIVGSYFNGSTSRAVMWKKPTCD